MRWYEAVAGAVVRVSEPGASLGFTPDGGHTQARVTRPTPPSEGETHWIVEASVDNVTFYQLSSVAIATTTYDDTATVSAYPNGAVSPLTGTFTLQKSYVFIAADQNRLLGFGSHVSTDKQNRIEISAVVGSRDQGDAERLDTTDPYTLDLDEADSGKPAGLRGPIAGFFYAFKDRQTWELAPTGNVSRPYRANALSKTLGCVGGHASCVGEDENGSAAIYRMTHRGVYQIADGVDRYIGKGIEDYVLGPLATMNLDATKVVCHMVFHADTRQVWVWWATGSSNDPDQCAFFDVGTGGWTRVPTTDKLATIRCSTMFATTIGATMSRSLKPYLGSASTANKIYKADDPTSLTDDGTNFQGYVIAKSFEPGGAGMKGAIGDAVLMAPAATGVTLTVSFVPDFGASPFSTGTADLTAVGSETRVNVRVQDTNLVDAQFVQMNIGEAAAAAQAWSIDRVTIPYKPMEAAS